MLRVLLYILLIYLVYQFVFKFLIPLYNTTQQLKKGFREMNNRMNTNNGPSTEQTRQTDNTPKEKVGEYIDFEEIK